jgi:hypothetical protein
MGFEGDDFGDESIERGEIVLLDDVFDVFGEEDVG